MSTAIKQAGQEPTAAAPKITEITPGETPQGAPWNDVEEAFLKRRSVRRYKKKQVPEHYIRRILEVARYAPSQGNCQPWRFIVVRDQDMIQEMEDSVKKMAGAMGPLPPEVLENMHPVPRGAMSSMAPDADMSLFWGAPTIIFPLMDTKGIGIPEVDLGIVGTNIVMAAYSLGLGTCWVGFAAMLNNTDWPKRLGIEEPYKLVEAITVGYPLGDPHLNMINRETHRISWFEDGQERTIY